VISTLDAEQRYRRLFDEYHRDIYAYCRRRTDAHTAADCAAETILVAWRRIDDVPGGAASLGWLYGVARKTLANEFRRSRRWRRLLTEMRRGNADPGELPEVLVVRREQDDLVLKAMAQLRPQDRELLQLALWEEMPHSVIAEMLGCSTQAVTQRVYRAVRRISREYQRLDRGQAVPRRQLEGGEAR
jgi:RNA polymerase sigma-70 factor (ECF subfamily)